MIIQHDTVFQQKDYIGVWWTNEEPEIKIDGVLSITANEHRLHLDGGLKQALDSPSQIIYGLVDNRPITIFDCMRTSYSQNLGGPITKESYVSLCTIFGYHFNDKKSAQLVKFTFGISRLQFWLETKRCKITRDQQDNLIFQDTAIDDLVLCNHNEFTLSVQYLFESFYDSENKKNIWDKGERLSVKPKELIPIFPSDESKYSAYDLIRSASAFITISMSKKSFWYDVKGIVQDGQDQVIIEIFWPQANIQKNESSDVLYKLMSLDSLTNANNILCGWFETYLYQHIPIVNYFSSFESYFHEQQIISLIHAIEGFHRRKYPTTKQEKAEHKEIIENFIRPCSDEAKAYIRKKLSSFNGPSLKKRLVHLFEMHSVVINWLVSSEENRMDYINMMTKLRNAYDHCKEDDFKHFMTDSANKTLHFLRAIFLCILLQQIGINDEFILSLYKEQIALRQLPHLLSGNFRTV